MTHRPDPAAAIAAQGELHHQYFLGLQLMVASRKGPQVVEDWMFRLFRTQHEAKFLSSFAKLGLTGLPDAVACARYHVLSNGVGGVPVEYAEESPQKAWVRFRYPRWMFDGPTLCGIPVEASHGFLRGWYAHNGVSLGNPNLGFVCVSQDMTGEFGFCGYFREFEQPLAATERLQFAPQERPPPWVADQQPQLPQLQWSQARLAKAKRNYAVEYIRNGVAALAQVVGREESLALASLAAKLTGLQHYPTMAKAVGAVDGGVLHATEFLERMLQGMGDTIERLQVSENEAILHQHQLNIARHLVDPAASQARRDLVHCWVALWQGAISSHRQQLQLQVEVVDAGLRWKIWR